jgi:hypothetical protein
MNTNKKKQKFIELFNTFNLDIDLTSIDFDINEINNFNEFYELLVENNLLQVDIIYYSDAINYLQKYDNSLRQSLELAEELGYNLSSVNSELLASILASNNLQEELFNYSTEIDNFIIDNN